MAQVNVGHVGTAAGLTGMLSVLLGWNGHFPLGHDVAAAAAVLLTVVLGGGGIAWFQRVHNVIDPQPPSKIITHV